MKTFEVTAAGFVGDGTTDDRVYWVRAESADIVLDAIKDAGAGFHDTIDCDSDIDFVLPRDRIALGEALLTWAGHERNKNRAV
jgi:hypothetical protein